mmetsp:Transcript_136315/g.261832  ORF Transcript_136315/g.261832 Transcript_136315/m.261832 type:complete len:249 (+) Transcript_136315:149-895(+)
MQSQGVDGMSWNSRYFEWQEGWKNDGWKPNMWFDQSSDGSCGGHYDAYGSWQPGNAGTQTYADSSDGAPANMTSGCGNGCAGGGVSSSPGHMYGAVDHEVHDATAMMGDLDLQEKPQTRWFAALEAAQEKPATGWFTPEARQQEKPQIRNWFGTLNSEAEQDREAMAEFEDSLADPRPPPADSSADTSGDEERSREVTAEEREEAERVVRTAFKEAKERDRLREKVKTASGTDLQAILNARLNKKLGK